MFQDTELDLSSFNGKVVSTVNGVPWLDYYSAFADQYLSISRDPNTRLNEALEVSFQGGPFRWTNGLMPPNDTITLGFNDGTTQVFDMLAYYTPTNFAGNLSCTHATSRRSANIHGEQAPVDVSRRADVEPDILTKLHKPDGSVLSPHLPDLSSSSFTTAIASHQLFGLRVIASDRLRLRT